MPAVYNLADLENWKGVARGECDPIRLGVLGDPVAHSLSPPMQNAALAHLGLKMRYARFQIAPNELERALHLFADAGFLGVNLTVPHKLAAFSFVQNVEGFARQVGAVNTIRFDDGNWTAANTDGPGFARAIEEEFGRKLHGLRVLVLGAGGGAGQAVATQCALAGCAALTLVNRDLAKAEALAARLGGPHIVAIPWSDDSLGNALPEIDLIAQATPLGLQPNDPSPLPRELLAPHHLVYELNYRPTALLAAARATGARAASGLTMLLHQGALAFEFWINRPAPLVPMRGALGLPRDSLDFSEV